ncbi:hypothetical protein ACFVJ4_39755 [Streptomyces sp. NPDC127178]|uniref:hypothetical protein n=1 Tax=unclassified Streptomyces TaxID=2593676 RepID=UPI003642A84F
MDSTLVRTAMSGTAPGAHHPAMAGTLARIRCTAPDVPHRTGAPTVDRPLDQVGLARVGTP